MRKFRKGDLVVLARISDPRYHPMNARTGSPAIVTSDQEQYVKIRWLDRSTAGNQSDGAYDPDNFNFANAAESKKIYALLDAEAQRAKNWTPPVRPFQVGDTVKNSNAKYMGVGTVLCVAENVAFIHFPNSQTGMKKYTTYRFNELTLQGDCNCD